MADWDKAVNFRSWANLQLEIDEQMNSELVGNLFCSFVADTIYLANDDRIVVYIVGQSNTQRGREPLLAQASITKSRDWSSRSSTDCHI